MKIMKKIVCMIMVLVIALSLCACSTQADRVSYNISQQADNFNVTRRLAVINIRTDAPVFELVGNFSIDNNMSNELEVTVEVSPGQYKKHFIYLNEWTMYVVEDVSGCGVENYHYEVNFLPEMFIPVTFTNYD